MLRNFSQRNASYLDIIESSGDSLFCPLCDDQGIDTLLSLFHGTGSNPPLSDLLTGTQREDTS